MRHGAVWSIDGNLHEFLFCLFVPEGVQQSYASLKRLLDFRVARHGKSDCAQLCGGEVFVMVALVIISNRGLSEGGERKKEKK
jgi:hypothetical protein